MTEELIRLRDQLDPADWSLVACLLCFADAQREAFTRQCGTLAAAKLAKAMDPE